MTTAIKDMTADEARALTEDLRSHLESAHELAIQLFKGRAWVALGYPSWDEYIREELGSDRLKIPRAARPDVVALMRQAGMSPNAIAAATGVSRRTVNRELQGGQTPTVPVTGTDGKTYKAKVRPVPTETIDWDNVPEPKPNQDPEARLRGECMGLVRAVTEVVSRLEDLIDDHGQSEVFDFTLQRMRAELDRVDYREDRSG